MSSCEARDTPASLLDVFAGKRADTALTAKVGEFLQQFLADSADDSAPSDSAREACFASSDPHSVASLLVQRLLSLFSQAFLVPASPEPALDQDGLRAFLCQDSTLLLLCTIDVIAQQVDTTYPELAELLVVVLRTLLSSSPHFEVHQGAVIDLIHLDELVQPKATPTSDSFPSASFLSVGLRAPPNGITGPSHTKTPTGTVNGVSDSQSPDSQSPDLNDTGLGTSPSGGECRRVIVPRQCVASLSGGREDGDGGSVPDTALYCLLLSVLESASTSTGPVARGAGQLGSVLHLLGSTTTLFEEAVSLWLRSYNEEARPEPESPVEGGDSSLEEGGGERGRASKDGHPPGYRGTLHVARIVLRLWVVLAQDLLCSPLSGEQLSELKEALFAPMAAVSQACYNLQRAGLFKDNRCLDHEFTLVFLEVLFCCLNAIGRLAAIPTCPVDDFHQSLRGCLTDSCQEWFAYLCSKLHSVSDFSDGHPHAASWAPVVAYGHTLLACLLCELIALSAHIQSCQKASKRALAGGERTSMRPVVYNLEVSMGLDKLVQRLSKFAQLLLDIFRSVPLIQLLSLQLLSETANDTVGIIGNFLANISDPSVWASPEVLDLYLELLERVWFRLSPDYAGSAAWWKRLEHYAALLREASPVVVRQTLYHVQCLLSHDSPALRTQLTRHVVLPFQAHAVARVREVYQRVLPPSAHSPGGDKRGGARLGLGGAEVVVSLDHDESAIVALFLKLVLKVVSGPASLAVYLADPTHLFSLFLFLPLRELCGTVLAVLDEVLQTLRRLPRPASPEPEPTFQASLVQLLLKLAFTIQPDHVPGICLSVAEGTSTISVYGLGEVDQVHQFVQMAFEQLPLRQLLTPRFVEHLGMTADLWGLLMRLARRDKTVLALLLENHIWDVIQSFAPSLGTLCNRINQRGCASPAGSEARSEGRSEGEQGGFFGDCMAALQERAVELMCHFVSLAHIVCWKREELKVMELHFDEVHKVLLHSNLCSIANSHLYCTALLKSACRTCPDPSSPPPSSQTLSPTPSRRECHAKAAAAAQKKLRSGIRREGSGRGGEVATASVSHCSEASSYLKTRPRFKVKVLVSDSDLSGYEADVERGSSCFTEAGESGGEERGGGEGSEGALEQSLVNYLVPPEVQQPLWSIVPLGHCIEVLRESLREGGINDNSEKSMEVFLCTLYGLLTAEPYNVELLAGKGLLEILLDSFPALFESERERSITCCRLLCRVAEVLARHQITSSETRKLFLRLQSRRFHLERLPALLHSVAVFSSEVTQPSAFIEFTYRKPVQALDRREMLRVPFSLSWQAQSRSVAMWLCISKYPLRTLFHLLTMYTGEVYLQVWACACSGDVIIRVCSQLQLDISTDTELDPFSQTLGSVITPGQWHHLVISVLPYSMQPVYELMVVIDGQDVYHYSMNLPPLVVPSNQDQYFLAGGAISDHTSEHHLRLVQAEKSSLSWKLGSLYVMPGFQNSTMATVLHRLGPDCPCSHVQAVDAVIQRYQFDCTMDSLEDISIVKRAPITPEERQPLLQQPYLAYSAHNPNKVFLLSEKKLGEDSYMQVPFTHELQWVASANSVTCPQLLDVVHSGIGIEQIIYLYAKVVSEGCSEKVQCQALSVLRLTVQHSLLAGMEFERLGGVRLLQHVLRTPNASCGKMIMEELLTWCCGEERLQVKEIEVLEHILLDWRVWHKAPPGVWVDLLWRLEQLLHHDANKKYFFDAKAIVKILLTSKERLLESLSDVPPTIAGQFVRIIEHLLDNPPQLDCLRYVCDHLLVPDLNEVKFVAGPSLLLETSVSPPFDGYRAGHSTPLPASHPGSVSSDLAAPTHTPVSPLPTPSQPHFGSGSDSGEEIIMFDVKPGEGRFPDSSYILEDSLFTWTDITGQLVQQESDSLEEIPMSIEVGLLGILRKIVTLLPDNMVRRVIGPVLQHESLIAIAHNPNIVVRTAVVRVLDEYFKRGGDGLRSSFVQVKGFNLLGSQLRQFKTSSELMSALCSVIIGVEVNLSMNDMIAGMGMFQAQHQLSSFHIHAVIPVLQCLVNAIGQPQLLHSTLCLLRELFETSKGMPAFLLNNGLIKILCQLISIGTEHPSITRGDKELILTDVLQFCKLIVIYTISSDHDEHFRLLDNLLVCLRHCCNEIRSKMEAETVASAHLHLMQYHVMAQALRYFQDDISGSSEGFVPTLPSISHTPGQSDLTARFISTCSSVVDWTVHGVSPYSPEQADHFREGTAMATGIEFDSEASTDVMDVAFTRFLLQYFYRSLKPIARKASNISLDRQRYSISSRSQLAEQLCRLFGHVISPVHAEEFRCSVLDEFWCMADARHIMTSMLTTGTIKKPLGSRLAVTIFSLLKKGEALDSNFRVHLAELFEVVCRSNATRLKPSSPSKLIAFLSIEEQTDTRRRQKYEGIIEELKSADQRWQERHGYDVEGFSQRQRSQYARLVEKARTRQNAIDRASSIVTTLIFERQSDLKRTFLDQISQAGIHERDTLRHWRRVIVINTHPRALWSCDEGRVMCWQLDPTEGPSRVRRRMMRAPRTFDDRFVLKEATNNRRDTRSSPLSFIFENTAYHSNDAIFRKMTTQEGEGVLFVRHGCSTISPDNHCRGNLIISNMRCYFVGDEPLNDPNITKVLPWDEETTLLVWEHQEIVEIHRRRYMLKNDALEIFLISGKTMLLSFTSTKERNQVHSELLQLELPNLVDTGETEGEKLKQVTVSWQQGEITNFEYLMELNKLAGRTFNDLMQYPVFPFVLADYKSEELDLRNPDTFRKLALPISVQDSNKVQKYVDTYTFLANETRASAAPGLPDQSSKPFHYGSHYSNSGIVLHFLVRVPPFSEMFIAFQGNSFDIADRTFRNIQTTWWLSSYESATDVKELIPEFFFLPEFLVNLERFDFGECQTGERVDNVKLPPWAKGDPRLFILKHRQALESEYVSKHLHSWIDLVFGFKQTGKQAVQCMNVFHPATYYGADGIDIDSVTDPTQQAAMRTMVKTYGQMPLQLFREPHPMRKKVAVLTNFRMRFGSVLRRLTSSGTSSRLLHPHFWIHLSNHKFRFNVPPAECDFIGAQGSELYFSQTITTERVPERIVSLGGGEIVVSDLQSSFFPSASPAHASLLVTWAKWDNSLLVRSASQDARTARLHQHPLNRVTCCECVCNGQMIVSGGTAGVVSFWQISNTAQSLTFPGLVTTLRGHEGPITCLAACKPYSVVVTGSKDRTCIIWDTNRLCYVHSLLGFEGEVKVIACSPTLGDIATVSASKSSKYACVLKGWTITGRSIKKVPMDHQINCLAYTAAPEGVYVNVLAGGLSNGCIRIWSSWDLSQLREISCQVERVVPVRSIAISSCSKELYAGYSNQQVVAWVKPKHEPNGADEAGYVNVSPSSMGGLESYYFHNIIRK